MSVLTVGTRLTTSAYVSHHAGWHVHTRCASMYFRTRNNWK